MKHPSPLPVERKINLCFGAVAPPFAEQLTGQGFKFDKKEINYLQGLFKHLLHVRMGLGLPDKPYYAMQNKLWKKIVKHVRSKNPAS